MNADGSCPNSNHWSGNLLNWLTMSNLDQFRSVLTGGARDTFTSVSSSPSGDSTTSTVLIRSFADRVSSTGAGGITPTKNLIIGTAGMP